MFTNTQENRQSNEPPTWYALHLNKQKTLINITMNVDIHNNLLTYNLIAYPNEMQFEYPDKMKFKIEDAKDAQKTTWRACKIKIYPDNVHEILNTIKERMKKEFMQDITNYSDFILDTAIGYDNTFRTTYTQGNMLNSKIFFYVDNYFDDTSRNIINAGLKPEYNTCAPS